MVLGKIYARLYRLACADFWRILDSPGCRWRTLRQFKIQVADGYTNMVANPGQVMIAVNHGTAELVADSTKQVDTINSKMT